jgi:hypothetical protein
MSEDLQRLLAMAKKVEFTERDREEQRRSFAYGNTKIENPKITRALINQEADSLKNKKS